MLGEKPIKRVHLHAFAIGVIRQGRSELCVPLVERIDRNIGERQKHDPTTAVVHLLPDGNQAPDCRSRFAAPRARRDSDRPQRRIDYVLLLFGELHGLAAPWQTCWMAF
ncbi:hypothetical protein D3C77_306780 [compost metagenome]